jgi:hypothetical protein
MDQEAFDIQTLVVADILGTISPEEKSQLEQLKIDRPDLQVLYDSIRDEMEKDNVAAYAGGSITAGELISKANRRVRIRNIRVFAAAACTIGLVGGLILFTGTPQPQRELAWKNDNTILLKIGKQVINLEENAATNIDGIALQPQTGLLTYSSLNASTQVMGMLTVPKGKNNYKVILDDGSEVLLNNASRLSFPVKFSKQSREISIDGEAYVKVAPRAGQPFIVHLPKDRQVDVLGTEFNVNTNIDGTARIALVQGSVRVGEGNSTAMLTPGKTATINNKTISVTDFNADEVLNWKEEVIVFPDNVTIEDIAAAVNTNTKEKMVVERSAAGKKFIGVILDKRKSIIHLLQQLTDTKEVTYGITKDGVIHIR